jgi:type III restriction enzyme
MKLHFEPNLDFQLSAIEAVCGLFRGQEACRTEFTVTRAKSPEQLALSFELNGLGIGNRLTLLDDEILKNLHEVQLQNGLLQSSTLATGDFTVEMETGTGKTYVYLRTILELNKRFGFTKFVIVVPSIAIKEGVYKALQMTEEHLRSLYANTPYEYFLYDSGKLGQVRNFATSSQIQIMIVTVGAINKKDVNNLYKKESEKTGDEPPIDLIRSTRPVLIVDEPQSVDGGLEGRGKEALRAMNPLCTLRYSATHVEKHHMVYKLDAVDAYERKLVKQIEIASATVDAGFNRPYVRLISVHNRRNVITAKVELDIDTGHGVKRQEKIVQDGDQLALVTSRNIYQDYTIGEIRVQSGNQFMELRFPGGQQFLKPDEAHGDVAATSLQREMIRRTIREHLDKEKRLRPQGIKVLSLFFIDRVEKYRQYDADGNPIKGEYAKMFEEEYKRLANHPDYLTLFKEVDVDTAAEQVHDGYFSIDKKGGWTDTSENNQGNRDNAERAYTLIMKEKERLLSLDTPLKFIFSHSALREGWDNPNVFQICALREMGSERERRQTIGRGLRLCVNKEGNRVRGFDINTLTVVANEAYEVFAENLQREIEQETGIRFGIVEKQQFATIKVTNDDGTVAPLGEEQSKVIWDHLKTKGYVNAQGKVQDTLKIAIKNNTLDVPEQFKPQLPEIKEVLRKLTGKLEIKNADERIQIRTRQAVFQSDEFRALWDRIKHKTTYRVNFDNEELIRKCITAVDDAPPISKTRLTWRNAQLSIGRSGVGTDVRSESAPVTIEEQDIELPDFITDLQDRTKLTRRSIVRILKECHRLNDVKRNPQEFVELVSKVIERTKQLAIVDGIKYQRLGDECYYAQELFEKKELTGYLKNMLKDTKKCVYEHVVYSSSPEEHFANDLERNEAVKVYAKLPGWFTVPTPLGTYNPDWAVLIDVDGTERLYLVVETKSSLFTDDLRDRESAKISCGEEHFKEIGRGENPARFIKATKLEDVFASAN